MLYGISLVAAFFEKRNLQDELISQAFGEAFFLLEEAPVKDGSTVSI